MMTNVYLEKKRKKKKKLTSIELAGPVHRLLNRYTHFKNHKTITFPLKLLVFYLCTKGSVVFE